MYIIDRIEGAYAVVETDEGMENIPMSALPENAGEGDILQKTAQGWTVDAAATQERREKLLARRRRLSGGDTA